MKQIARALDVSPGSVHLWTRDIELTPAQITRNRAHMEPGPIASARGRAWSERCRARRREYQEEGRQQARAGGALHEAGCMLYWAEGAKSRNTAKIGNSDPHLVRFFLGFLRRCFDVQDSEVSLRLNVYTTSGLSVAEIERYWLQLLELPSSGCRKHTLDHFPTSSSGSKVNRLPFGVCTVGTSQTRIVQHIYGAIQEYGGFEEPRWLD